MFVDVDCCCLFEDVDKLFVRYVGSCCDPRFSGFCSKFVNQLKHKSLFVVGATCCRVPVSVVFRLSVILEQLCANLYVKC